MLVYGRWLRAARPDPPAEARVLRTLQEYDVGIARRLANNPPEDAKERNKLEERLVLVRWQARYIAPFAVADKAEVLGKIDRRTAEWLEAHRARVESLDFDVFDTAAPPRPGPPASYQMKRGHPILIDRMWWDELLALPETATLRDFIRAHQEHIRYVVVGTDSVLKDMDTPEEYDDLIKE